MLRLGFLSVLILLATLSISRAQDDTYILSWINKFFQSKGAYFFDPSPNQTVNVNENNLRPTSLEDDKYYLYFAFAAYCGDSLKDWSCTYCKSKLKTARFDSEVSSAIPNTKAYFAIDDNRTEIVLTFRGSFNVPNALYDNDNRLVPVSDTDRSDIRVHAGFLNSTMTLYPRVVSRLQNLTETYPNYKVKITGHSLGGSQAALAIFLFRYNGLFNDTDFSVFTYGEPRDGNLEFATYFNKMDIASARVVHRADFAPHIVAQYNQSYVHHGIEVWNFNSTYTKNCSSAVFEDPTCSNTQGPGYSIADHLIYFGEDVAQCGFDDPIESALQVIIDLNSLIPTSPSLLAELTGLLNSFRIPFKYTNAVLQLILNPLGK